MTQGMPNDPAVLAPCAGHLNKQKINKQQDFIYYIEYQA
jgi:hypothetical protein